MSSSFAGSFMAENFDSSKADDMLANYNSAFIEPLDTINEKQNSKQELEEIEQENKKGDFFQAYEAEKIIREETNEQILWRYIIRSISAIRNLYNETIKGPGQLGVIDTTKYDRISLDGSIMELLNEVFDFHGQQYWIVTQIMFFLQPIIYGLGRPIINRFQFIFVT